MGKDKAQHTKPKELKTMLDLKARLIEIMNMTVDEYKALKPNLPPLMRSLYFELAKLSAQKELIQMQLDEALEGKPETHEEWMTEAKMMGFDHMTLNRVDARIAQVHTMLEKIRS